MRSQRDDAEQEEAEGKLCQAIAGDGKGVGNVGPEDGIGRVVEAQDPEAEAEAVVCRDVDAGAEGDEQDPGADVQVVFEPENVDDADAVVDAERDEAECQGRHGPHGRGHRVTQVHLGITVTGLQRGDGDAVLLVAEVVRVVTSDARLSTLRRAVCSGRSQPAGRLQVRSSGGRRILSTQARSPSHPSTAPFSGSPGTHRQPCIPGMTWQAQGPPLQAQITLDRLLGTVQGRTLRAGRRSDWVGSGDRFRLKHARPLGVSPPLASQTSRARGNRRPTREAGSRPRGS